MLLRAVMSTVWVYFAAFPCVRNNHNVLRALILFVEAQHAILAAFILFHIQDTYKIKYTHSSNTSINIFTKHPLATCFGPNGPSSGLIT
jgi:hypothetical protein